ncbi:MAG: DUF4132 domain-containing protein [Myxococcota bacterium]
MRRFEFSEGTSNKFWQAEVKGGELWVTFGKIGTAGQTQVKDLGTAGAAEAAMDKLIQEKSKKGYAEVTVDASAAETTSPATPTAKAKAKASEPAPDPVEAKAEPKPVAKAAKLDTAAFTERLGPRTEERTPPVDAPLMSEAECLKQIVDELAKVSWSSHTGKSEIQSGLAHATGPYKAFAERVLETYAVGKAPGSLDADADAGALHLLPTHLVLPIFFARGGLTYLLKVLLRSMTMRQTSMGGQGGSWRYIEDHQPSLQYGVPYTASSIGEYRRRATPDDLAAAEKVAASAAGEPLPVRIAVALALQDRALMAACAGEVLALKKNEYSYVIPRMIFSLLRDPVLLERFAARHPDEIPMEELWDELGLAALPMAVHYVEKDPKSEFRLEAVARAESLVLAKAMVEGLVGKRSAEVAKKYYEKRPDLAIAALAPVVARGDKIAPYAKAVLDQTLRAHSELIAEVAPKLEGKARALIEGASKAELPEASAKDIPAALASAPPPPKKGKVPTLPAFVEVAALPRLSPRGKEVALPISASEHLLAILQRSSLAEPHPLVEEVKASVEPASAAAFTWALFEAWLASGTGSKENWAFTALGLFGDDEAARRLTPMIRAWPGESQHARAGVGLEVLAGIGTDLALMHLHGIAEKVKFKALQEKAKEKMEVIAAARGLTAEELADRLVPDLDLDEGGSLTLDFGPRAFTVTFDEALKPMVKDASGKILGDLPKPNKSDEADKAEAATERFKTLKKDARAIASLQLVRLELTMCNQRRWKVEDFSAFILKHPLLVHLARRLVWGVFEGDKLSATFRVAEDGTFADEKDEAYTLGKKGHIGLVHRLELSESLQKAWGTVFSDYKILQPFEQLGRQIYAPTEAEKKANVLPRMQKVDVKTGKVMGLEIRGWKKGTPEDAGWVWDMSKNLAGGFVVRMGISGGFCMGAPDMNPPTQQLTGIGIETKDGKKATFGQLSATAFSELVKELEGLRE